MLAKTGKMCKIKNALSREKTVDGLFLKKHVQKKYLNPSINLM